MADKGMLSDVAYPEGFYPEWFLKMIASMSPEEQEIMKEKYRAVKQGGKPEGGLPSTGESSVDSGPINFEAKF